MSPALQSPSPMACGIGTLGEKSLHRAIKYYLEPNSAYHEVPVGRHIADILRDGHIIEVQTGSFTPLARKLPALLERFPVTVVYPIPHYKYIHYIEETGEVSAGRRSPKTGAFWDCFFELSRIAALIPHPHLTLHLMLVDLQEYRTRQAVGRVGRRSTARVDRIPTQITAELLLRTPADYWQLLPPLPDPFTAKELQKCIGRSPRTVHAGLYALERLGAIRRMGKRGNAILYSISQEEHP